MTDSELNQIIENWLGGHGPLEPFFRAVIQHLTRSLPAGQQKASATQIARHLAELSAHENPRALLNHPPLLASLFQNADLLDPADPASARIANSVMTALSEAG